MGICSTGSWFAKGENTIAVASGSQTLATSGTITLTQTSVPGVAAIREAIIQNTDTTNNVRYWIDGTVPTTTTGFKLAAGGLVAIQGEQNIKNLRMVCDAGTVVVAYSLLV